MWRLDQAASRTCSTLAIHRSWLRRARREWRAKLSRLGGRLLAEIKPRCHLITDIIIIIITLYHKRCILFNPLGLLDAAG